MLEERECEEGSRKKRRCLSGCEQMEVEGEGVHNAQQQHRRKHRQQQQHSHSPASSEEHPPSEAGGDMQGQSQGDVASLLMQSQPAVVRRHFKKYVLTKACELLSHPLLLPPSATANDSSHPQQLPLSNDSYHSQQQQLPLTTTAPDSNHTQQLPHTAPPHQPLLLSATESVLTELHGACARMERWVLTLCGNLEETGKTLRTLQDVCEAVTGLSHDHALFAAEAACEAACTTQHPDVLRVVPLVQGVAQSVNAVVLARYGVDLLPI